jgi:hypothetical protein
VKIIRRKKPPAPEEAPRPQTWVEIDHYPFLDEWIRGCRVFRTKEEPLRYRITTSPLPGEKMIRWPAVVAIKNERRIRFGDYPVEIGWHDRGEKVDEWRSPDDPDQFPDFRNADVYISNPDYVTMTAQWGKRTRR